MYIALYTPVNPEKNAIWKRHPISLAICLAISNTKLDLWGGGVCCLISRSFTWTSQREYHESSHGLPNRIGCVPM